MFCHLAALLLSNAPTLVGPPTTPALISTAIADTGSTAHFCTNALPVKNKQLATTPIAIRNPNGAIMYSTHTAKLDIPGLPPAARRVHIVPALESKSLISMGQLCDAGCTIAFTATTVTVHYQEHIVLTGTCTSSTRLWHLASPHSTLPSEPPSPASPNQEANAAIGSATPKQLVAFTHAALFSPTLSTLATALDKGYLVNFPGLSFKLLRRHPPHSYAMIKGHLDQSRQGQRSTQPTLIPVDDPSPLTTKLAADVNNAFPSSPSEHKHTHFCYTAIMEPTGQIYTDQTGQFVTPSSNGNNYLLILYDYDSNCILAKPLIPPPPSSPPTSVSTPDSATLDLVPNSDALTANAPPSSNNL
jgi:hypothetical protein